MTTTFNVNGKEFAGRITKPDKSLNLDNLHETAHNFVNNVIEVENEEFPTIENNTIRKLVCKIYPDATIPNFYRFTWAYTLQDVNVLELDTIKNIPFTQNYDSLVDYTIGFCAPVEILFTLLNQIMLNLNSTQTLLFNRLPNDLDCDVYMDFINN